MQQRSTGNTTIVGLLILRSLLFSFVVVVVVVSHVSCFVFLVCEIEKMIGFCCTHRSLSDSKIYNPGSNISTRPVFCSTVVIDKGVFSDNPALKD
jgi:hypothetical protein